MVGSSTPAIDIVETVVSEKSRYSTTWCAHLLRSHDFRKMGPTPFSIIQCCRVRTYGPTSYVVL